MTDFNKICSKWTLTIHTFSVNQNLIFLGEKKNEGTSPLQIDV